MSWQEVLLGTSALGTLGGVIVALVLLIRASERLATKLSRIGLGAGLSACAVAMAHFALWDRVPHFGDD